MPNWLIKKDREHQFWQEGNHPVLMQNDDIMRQKVEHIHYNLVRGYVDDPAHWRYSIARNYSGMEGLLGGDAEVVHGRVCPGVG